MTFSLSQFKEMFPRASHDWGPVFLKACSEADITTPLRLAGFFANVSHESMGLTRFEESFNYSPVRLREVFPKYFKRPNIAEDYVKLGPRAIASRVYAFRMGNGSEVSTDGWRYRGRGPIMLSGSKNYIEFGKALDQPLWSQPDLVLSPHTGARSACLFWVRGKCNELMDVGNFDGVCDKINIGRVTQEVGDSNGFADRAFQFKRILEILEVK